ncbi:SGNH hydrolase-type esterase domain-containing protein, partial [Blyttiomyces helicus]
QGWGVPGALYFELPVVNLAAAGRSTRSYIRDGHWARVLKSVQPGDFVVMEFGHNDGAPLVAFGARGTLPGVGNATQTVAVNGVEEVVHTFGYYLNRMSEDVKALNATPIISSMTPRLNFANGVEVVGEDHVTWASETAAASGIHYIDHNLYTAEAYTALGENATTALFVDRTHTDSAGAVYAA